MRSSCICLLLQFFSESIILDQASPSSVEQSGLEYDQVRVECFMYLANVVRMTRNYVSRLISGQAGH